VGPDIFESQEFPPVFGWSYENRTEAPGVHGIEHGRVAEFPHSYSDFARRYFATFPTEINGNTTSHPDDVLAV
jgi:hypothetical protein